MEAREHAWINSALLRFCNCRSRPSGDLGSLEAVKYCPALNGDKHFAVDSLAAATPDGSDMLLAGMHRVKLMCCKSASGFEILKRYLFVKSAF